MCLAPRVYPATPAASPYPAPRWAPAPALLTCQRALSSLLSRLHCIWITWGQGGPRSPTKAWPQQLVARAEADPGPRRDSKDWQWGQSSKESPRSTFTTGGLADSGALLEGWTPRLGTEGQTGLSQVGSRAASGEKEEQWKGRAGRGRSRGRASHARPRDTWGSGRRPPPSLRAALAVRTRILAGGRRLGGWLAQHPGRKWG